MQRKLGLVYREQDPGDGCGLWKTKLSTEMETLTHTGLVDSQTTIKELSTVWSFINRVNSDMMANSWYDAQTYCREKYTDLVSVRNQTENDEIWSVVKVSDSKGVWIGLFNDSWNWSDQSNSLFGYWSSDKPSGSLICAAVSESEQRYWTDVNCTEKLPFICHENKLILIKDNLTWKEALIYCRNHHHDLVSVRSEEMQLWVKEVTQNASTEHVWLGLRHTCALGFWYWVNGEMICYQNWAPSNRTGSEDCSHEERTGAVQSGGEQKWISLPRSQKLNFICSTYEDTLILMKHLTWKDPLRYSRNHHHDQRGEKRSSAVWRRAEVDQPATSSALPMKVSQSRLETGT
ncbi:secretory phospholipase A2 receptor-like [Tachysurus fulvidraco]|uniref:secretory phospholipase A2 receptor-like n=1 Tax=Tachysurus fulvidraco TaxID=1234273 RepID=UPI001FF00A7F|nr:secretory phospholipase A2 receptor-like [Tachysurus fulvidraco]